MTDNNLLSIFRSRGFITKYINKTINTINFVFNLTGAPNTFFTANILSGHLIYLIVLLKLLFASNWIINCHDNWKFPSIKLYCLSKQNSRWQRAQLLCRSKKWMKVKSVIRLCELKLKEMPDNVSSFCTFIPNGESSLFALTRI